MTKRFVSALLVSLGLLCGHPLLQAQAPHGGPGVALQPGPNVNAAGGIVNPGDPAALIKSDILLQRQNETVVAGSTRNPDHLLAAANDYRFVDFPDDPAFGGGQTFIARLIAKLFRRPAGKAVPAAAAAGNVGAWTGIYRSCDRGRTWIGSALPGGPLDNSLAAQLPNPLKQLSLSAPANAHAETTDPVLMAGPGGRMHMAVLGFIRFADGSVGSSRMFYASYTDRNNLEGGSCFNFDFVRQIDTSANYVGPNSPSPFLDKPSLAVDKDGMIVVSYTLFTDAVKSKIVIARSVDGGGTWTRTMPLLSLGFLRNHGTSTTIDPLNGTVFVAWRLFYQEWPLMVMSRSFDRGRTFLPATPISEWWPARSLDQIVAQLKAAKLRPFDQFNETPPGADPSRSTARSLAFPTIAAGVVNGQSRLYAAWQERARVDTNPQPASPAFGFPYWNGSPRVMFTMSTDGGWSWNARRAIDAGPRTEHPTLPGFAEPAEVRPSGPQVQPVLSMSGVNNPQLLLMYYEARNELAGPFGSNFISGIERQMDVRSARINPATGQLVARSVQVAQYSVKANSSPVELTETAPGYDAVSRANLWMYGGGTKAFFGDYPHLAPSTVFEFDTGTRWKWASEPASALAIWTDHRDVQFPANGIGGAWNNYTPITNPALANCSGVALRNANPYFTEIAGVVAGSPQNFKPLNLQRTFVTYVENRTTVDRVFQLTLTGTPASFDQFAVAPALVVPVFAHSSHTQTIWVAPNTANPRASARMSVIELGANNLPVTGGYRTSVTLNPDPNNDALTNIPTTAPVPPGTNTGVDGSELHNPQVSAPQVSAFDIKAPQVSAPQVSAPQVSAPQVSAPQVSAPQVSAPQVSAPQVSATTPDDGNEGTDVSYTVTNTGNTESTYNAFLNVPNVREMLDGDHYDFQLLITRTSLVPGFAPTANGCVPAAETRVQVIANLQIPTKTALQFQTVSGLPSGLATFSVAPAGGADASVFSSDGQSVIPRDEVKVTLRAIRLKPLAAIPPALVFNPQAVVVTVASTSTNVFNGVVQGESAADAPTASSGALVVSTTGDSGPGSLRQAILNANANPDPSSIVFDISGEGPRTISPTSALPTIIHPVSIDGTTQPGYENTPVIELEGSSAGAASGLFITAGNSTVRGLAINRFVGEGIVLRTGGGNLIEGNFIGTDVTGTLDRGNTNSGIFITWSDGNLVTGNVVSGNDGFAGIAICGFTVCGGGPRPLGGSLATGNVLKGNLLGTAVNGTDPLGNGGFGVSIDGTPNTLLGGIAAGEGNTLAFNGSHGVFVFNAGATGNQFLRNSIHSNAGLGISLTDSVPGPVLTSATATTVQGSLSGVSGTDYVIDFYSSLVCDPSGSGEGQTWVGSITVAAPGAFTATLSPALAVGSQITALATSTSGGTSEFSGCRIVSASGGTITSVSPATGSPGEGFLVVRGTGFPSPSSGVATVSNGAGAANGFVFLSPSTTSAYWVRLPSGFPLGSATIQLTEPSTGATTNAFPITLSATPGTPIITDVLNSGFVTTTTVNTGNTIYVQADGIDTSGSVVRFQQDGFDNIDVIPVQAVSSQTIGLTVQVTVPALVTGTVAVSIRQGASAFSAPVTLTVPPLVP